MWAALDPAFALATFDGNWLVEIDRLKAVVRQSLDGIAELQRLIERLAEAEDF